MKRRPAQRPRLLVEELERRILYSADAAALLGLSGSVQGAEVRVVEPAAPAHPVAVTTATAQQPQSREIVFIDSRVPDAMKLADQLMQQRGGDRTFDIVVLDANQDGVAQIDKILANEHGLTAIHIISHGSDGAIEIGSTDLDAARLAIDAKSVAQWGQSLAAGGDLLLYGCDVAKDAVGQAFVRDMARLTGADVAASTDLTGSASIGGNWTLEYATGVIHTQLAPSTFDHLQWTGVLTTYTVTNTNDSGAGSLRQAIIDANNNVGADLITFNIAGTGVHTIAPTSALPQITGTVTIDATTDDSFATNGNRPAIILSGTNAGFGKNGLVLTSTAGGSTIRGLVVRDWDSDGIEILTGSNNNLIVGNYVGRINPDGTAGAAGTQNNGDGIWIQGSNNTIGGTTAADRNVFAGNDDGVTLDSGATGNSVIGNYIGTDATGSIAVGNTLNGGVWIKSGSSNNTIGGTSAGAGNVISGNTVHGVFLDGTTSGNLIQGNYIGLNAAGTAALGNSGDGINADLGANNNTIGGTVAGARNVISGNATGASGTANINLTDVGTSNNLVQGNYIGTDYTGTVALANPKWGIYIDTSASNNTIGGTTAGAGNLITGNTQGGIGIISNAATGNSILGNAIYSNAGMGIDLKDDGVTANDPAPDSDVGPNNLQNFPVLTSASANAAGTTIVGTFTSAASKTYRIEFFANRPSVADATNGEGERYLGFVTVTTDGSGNGTINTTLANGWVNAGDKITATATVDLGGGNYGDTSEFAANVTATSTGIVVVDTTSDVADGNTASIATLGSNRGADGRISLREAIAATNATPGLDTIAFNIAGAGVHTINVTTALPGIFGQVVIDGWSDVNYAGAPVIELNGAGAGASVSGLTLGAGSAGSTVRGLVINRFTNEGIDVLSSGNLIVGNYIGTDASGKFKLGNANDGIEIANAANNTIGGTTAAERNIISGNGLGIRIAGSSTSGNVISGNYIGADSTGATTLGNTLHGIFFTPFAIGGASIGAPHDNRVGGTAAGAGNLIVNNGAGGGGWDGISLHNTAGIVSNAILGNSIYANGDLGIDLANNGVSANDAGDPDSGPNNLQNFPVLTSANSIGGNTTIAGSLNSSASTTYRIEFFASATGDASGNGEGQTYLGFTTVTTDGSGNASFAAVLSSVSVTAGSVVSATATVDLGSGNYGDTSEFAANVTAIGAAPGITVRPLPSTAESRVNTTTAGAQEVYDGVSTAVAADANGNYVIVWLDSGGADGSGKGIYGQRFNAAGVAQSAEFRVNTFTTGDQRMPAVAMDASGNFVVVWASAAQDGSGNGVYGQRYNAAGVAQGSEFRVNTTTANDQSLPAIAMNASGAFVVTWVSALQDGSGTGMYAQRYNAAGVAQGSEFRVNTTTAGNQDLGTVAIDTSGNFVVTWTSAGQDGSGGGVYAQRYNAAGVAQGSEFRVNTTTAGNQYTPFIAMTPSGAFVIAWTSVGQDGDQDGVYFQRYDAAGTAQGAETRANTFTTNSQQYPVVAIDSSGNFVIAWTSWTQDGSGRGAYAQRYAADGSTRGGEFRINTTTAGDQYWPALAMLGTEKFVAVWNGNGPGDADGVFQQQYNFTTNESGASAQFSVVLDAAPTANVTIAVASSNATEGTPSTSLLTFTPANWNVAQTVTVTGVQDFVNDGNVVYTILTGAASSADAAYNGLNPSDVVFTNLPVANVAPVNSVPGAQTVNEDTKLVFSSGNGNLISISDSDAGINAVQVTMTVTNGALTLSGTSGLSFSVGSGSANATMTFTGTIANINAALAGMSFTPTANFNGAASLQIVTNDQGNTGTGGALSDTDPVAITVNPINDAPVQIFTGTNFNGTYAYNDASGNWFVQNTPVNTGSIQSQPSGAVLHLSSSAGGSSTSGVIAYFDGSMKLGDLEGASVASSGNALAMNLYLDTGNDGSFFSFNGNQYTGLNGDSYASVTLTASGGTIDDNTVFTKAAGIAALPSTFTLGQLKSGAVAGIDANTRVALWVGGGSAFSTDISSVSVAASTAGSLTVQEDSGLTSLGLAGAAFGPGGGADEAGQTLTYTVTAVPNAAIGNVVLADGTTVVTANTGYSLSALQGMQFRTNTDANGAAGTFSFSVQDNGGVANGGQDTITKSLAINVAAVNDAPVNALPAAQITNVNTPIVLSGPNAISVSDVDAGTGQMRVTLGVADYQQGFDSNSVGWNMSAVEGGSFVAQNDATVVASGTNGITARSGSTYAVAAQNTLGAGGSAFTPFAATRAAGYSNVFPPGGFTTSVDVYLDPSGGYANNTQFDYTAAISDVAIGGNGLPLARRDFVFNAGFYNDVDATGSTNRFIISASNNAGHTANGPRLGASPLTITTAGWYTLEHHFYDSGGGVLAVDLIVKDSAGNVLSTWTRSNPTDIIGSTVGGSRYGWFANQEFSSLAFDNVSKTSAARGTLTLGSTANLTFSQGTGINDSRMTFTGTLADINAAIGSVTYQPATNYSGNAALLMVSNDMGNTGAGGPMVAFGAVPLTVNARPVVTVTGTPLAYTENDPATVVDPGLTVSDADSVNLTGATVSISSNYANGQDALAFTSQNGITGSWDAGTGTLTLSGTTTVANYQAALRSVTYVNSSDAPSTLDRKVSFTAVDEGGLASTAASRTVTVAAVNDAPTLGNGTLASVSQNTANPSGQSVSTIFAGQFADVDAGASMSGIALVGNSANAATQGSWQYSTNAGGNWYAIGTVADGSTPLALSSSTLVRFVPVAGYNGTPAALVVRGLDNTYAGAFSTTSGGEVRATVDTTSSGGATAIAAATASLSTSIMPNGTGAISGTIFEDVNGDSNLSDAVASSNVTVRLYQDNGDGTPDAADTLVATATTAAGNYSFTGLANATYWVVVDSKTITPSAGFNPGFGADDVWATQTYGAAGSVAYSGGTYTFSALSGSFFGGMRSDVSDTASSLATSQHVTREVVTGSSITGVNDAFSFNVVTTTRGGDSADDDGSANRTVQGSLRQFIQNANAIAGANVMRFVPTTAANASDSVGNSWWRLDVTNILPSITDAGTTVDGTAYSAADGTTVRDTNAGQIGAGGAVGVDGLTLDRVNRPELEIAGSALNAPGITVDAASGSVRNLAIDGFVPNGGGATYAGTQLRITNAATNAGGGVLVSGNLIGAHADGTNPGVAQAIGISLNGAATVSDNYIAFTRNNGVMLSDRWMGQPNTQSVTFADNELAFIGDPTGGSGDMLSDISNGVVIRGNYLHDFVSNQPVQPYFGKGIEVWYQTQGALIENNTIVNMRTAGIGVNDGAQNNTIRRNVITGTTGDGTNGGAGILVTSFNNTATSPPGGNRITENAIYANAGLGIDVDPRTAVNGSVGDGVTPNDLGDADTGGNGLQNFPVLSSAATTGSQIAITGTLNSSANSYYRIEFFANATADASGYGEGQRFIGFANVSTDASGNATISTTLTATVAVGESISATATKSESTFTTFSDTSEFAQDVTATAWLAATNMSAAETYTEDTALNLTGIVVSSTRPTVTASLTLSNAAAGSLNTATSGSVTSTYNAGTGVWSASGAVADVNALLAGLTFTPTANFNANFTIATSVSDGVAAPVTGSKAITGIAVNDAPIRTAGAVSNLTVLEDSGLTSLGLGGVAYGPGGGADESGQTLSYTVTALPSSTIGNVFLADGTTQVTLGSYTLAEIQGMQFKTTANASGVTGFQYNVVDSGGTANGGSNSVSEFALITVTAVNDAPTLSATALNPGFTEAPGLGTQAAAVNVFGSAAASTVESADRITGLTLTVGGLVDGANEVIVVDGRTITLGANSSGTTATNGLTYSATLTGNTATLVLSGGTLTTAATQTLVNGITYQNTNTDNPTPGNRVVTLTQIKDNGGTANGGVDTTALAISSTVTVSGVNDAPTGAPVVTGVATEGQTLAADTATITDPEGLGAFSYQWQRNGIDIGGATGSTYLLGNADVGSNVRVVVSYTDGRGTAESLTSAAVGPVANVNDAPTGAPIVTGTPTENQVLSADTSTIADADGLGAFSYQWQRNGVAVVGATASTYTLGNADVGANMRVVVSYTDGHGTAESLTSAAVGPVANVNDAPTGAPVVTGTTTENQVLSADMTTIADADGLGAFSYQWQRNGVAVVGATSSTYTLGNADVGANMRVVVSYTDGHGTAESLTSAAVGPVVNVNDAPTGAPVIAGTPTENQVLSADTSTIADADGLGTFSYQWQRNGVNVVGATASTYTLGNADVGTNMRVVVSYTDGHGTAESLTSAAVGPVANVNDAPTGAAVIAGTPTENQVLSADTSTIADADGLGAFSYQWQRNGVAVVGATASTYTLGNADDGANMRVVVSYTDGHGTAESLTSAAVGPVANVNDAPTGAPVVTGTPTENQVLSADTTTIADADGLGAFSYQWQRNGVNIGGATGSTYTLGNADVGANMRVVVSYTDGHGTAESLTSAAVGPVANVNAPPSATNLSAPETYTQNSPLALTPIVVSDVDSPAVSVTLTLSNVAAGSLSTGTSGGVTSTYDAASGVWSASGAIADVNALLAGLTFTPSASFNANFTIATSVSDGVAPPITGSKAITGVALNQAPVITTANLSLQPGQPVIVTPAQLNASDADTPVSMLVFNVSNVSGGRFELVAAPGVPVTQFTQPELVQGQVRFVPTSVIPAPRFDVIASDGSANSALITVVVNVGLSLPSDPVIAAPATTQPGEVTDPGAPAPTTAGTATSDVAAPRVPLTRGEDITAALGIQDTQFTYAGTAPFTNPAPSLQRATRVPHELVAKSLFDLDLTINPDAYLLRTAFLQPLEGPALNGGELHTGAREASAQGAEQASDDDGRSSPLVVKAAQAAGVALTVGTVLWALRAGGLAASLFSSLPAWRHVDLLAVLPDEEDEDKWDGDADAEGLRDEQAVGKVLEPAVEGDA